MLSVFSMKAVRLLLSVGVSLWMAGACLFSCSNIAMAAESEHEAETAVAVPSCHAKHAKQQQQGGQSFTPAPHEMMKECPLVVNATAVTSKNNGHLPDFGRVPVSALPLIEKTIQHSRISDVVEYLPNRGPTHLRCCVFLI